VVIASTGNTEIFRMKAPNLSKRQIYALWFISETFLNKYNRLPYNAIVAFLENALWKNRVIETIGSIGIKGFGVACSDSPS
jgi:hypothetical protein